MKLTREFVRGEERVVVSAEHVGGNRWRVRVGDQVRVVDAVPLPGGGVRLQPASGGRALLAQGAPVGKAFMVRLDGQTHTLVAPAARRGGAGGAGDGTVRAPMTGTVLEIACAAGDTVTAQQPLVVVSAMKMEHKLVAGVAGVVRAVNVVQGAAVEQGQALVVVEAAKTPA